jgi:hypothetical protein
MGAEPPKDTHGASPVERKQDETEHSPGDVSPTSTEQLHHTRRRHRGNVPGATHCAICHKRASGAELSPSALHGVALNQYIREQAVGWQEDQPICHRCLNRFRGGFVAHTIVQERGELTQLEEEVIRSLQEQAIISEDINTLRSIAHEGAVNSRSGGLFRGELDLYWMFFRRSCGVDNCEFAGRRLRRF